MWNILRHVHEVHNSGDKMLSGRIIRLENCFRFPNRFLTPQLYRDTVIKSIVPFVSAFGQIFPLMHGNAPPHTARIVNN